MKIFKDKDFKELTTFRIGGAIKYFAEAKNSQEVEEAVCFAKKNNLKIFTIGGGSDFLASDKPFEGIVIKYVGKDITFHDDGTVTSEAGLEWDELVEKTVEKNFQGLESLSGIPGTVGASPIQNIGAYGAELKDTFIGLTAYDIDKEEFVTFSKSDCKFGYRESVFKEKSHWQKYIITDVTLMLNKNGKPNANYESLKGRLSLDPTIREVRDVVLKVRAEKLEDPRKIGNAGSFFMNPIISSKQKADLENKFPDLKIFPFDGKFKLSAAQLIEKAGWKGKEYKGAGVSKKHALIIVNEGSAKASDVIELSEKIIEDVKGKFGVTLQREVQLINF